MTCFDTGKAIDLAKRDNLPLHDVRGMMLRVTRGALWITQEGDPRDLVLRTGDTFRSAAGARLNYGNYFVLDLNAGLRLGADRRHRLSLRLENGENSGKLVQR